MPGSETKIIAPTFPSPDLAHRRADLIVHILGLGLILVAGSMMLSRVTSGFEAALVAAVVIYLLCHLISNLASFTYHFAPWHDLRPRLRRVDHAAIYLSICGTFTPFFILAGTPLTLSLLVICWGLAAVAIWLKIFGTQIKSRWSTASYLGLGAIGLAALPDQSDLTSATVWCVLAGAVSYVVGTGFYARKSLPYRYAIWHVWVYLGGGFMFAGIWIALFG